MFVSNKDINKIINFSLFFLKKKKIINIKKDFKDLTQYIDIILKFKHKKINIKKYKKSPIFNYRNDTKKINIYSNVIKNISNKNNLIKSPKII
jgi:hypothetical protein